MCAGNPPPSRKCQNGIPNPISSKKNQYAAKNSLSEALAMLDDDEFDSVGAKQSESVESSDMSDLEAMMEVAVAQVQLSKKEAVIKKPQQQTKASPKPVPLPSLKRPANSVNDELAAKKAKIQQALMVTTPVAKRRPITNFRGQVSTPSIPSRLHNRLSVPAEPIAVKSHISASGGPSSTIHGRKTMSVRKQEEQIRKTNISDVVLRLKAEIALTEKTSNTVRRVSDNNRSRGTHAAAFGSIQSVSRLPFMFDEDEKQLSGVKA